MFDPLCPVGQNAARVRALVLRLGLSGALAGALAAACELASIARGAATFLPTGRSRLLGFLVGLYGGAGLLCGLVLGLLAWLIGRGDVGRAIRAGRDPTPPAGGRVVAYALLAVGTLAAVGLAARPIVESILVAFHHRLLIAAVAGAALATLALAGALVAAIAAPLLSYATPFGPRLHPRLRGAPIAALPAVVGAFYLGAGAVAADVLLLEQRPRMTHALRAANAALAAPPLLLVAALLAWGLYRLTARTALARVRPRFALVLGATVAKLAAPLAIAAAATWSTTRQLDLRPFLTGAAIVLALVALAGATRRPAGRALLVTAPLCAALLLGLGRAPRVRKATALAGLAPHLLRGIQLATDVDRDGFSSVLGGGDCDDLDPRVHPGAFDWPDDGIDQDCNGHEATLADRAPRRYAPVPDAVPHDPNVLLLTIDALRADHVSSYGYERRTTPRLDDLAKDGVRFENAWAHAPSTRYSVPAILIGRYPSAIPVNNDPRVHWPPQVLPENRLVSEILKDLGYRTAATLSYHYFEPGWGLDQGFDDYDYHLYTLHSVGGDPAATSGSSARELADLDVTWLRAHAGQRFFLWSHFYDTHFRFERHPELPESDFGSDELALYDGEIRYTDHHIGRVFDELKALGLWDKTIIIVTADHGDGFGEHGIPASRRHGYHLYRTETKVPILIRVPGLPPRIVDTPIGHVDLLPTLLNLLRRPERDEPQLLGESALAAMLGDESARDTRHVYQEVWYEGPTSKKALATRAWHLIRNLVPEDTTELYDLAHDPAEEHDLSGFGDAVEARLAGALAEITDALAIPPGFAARMKDAVGRAAPHPSRPLDDRIGDALRVVGADVAPPRAHAGEAVDVAVHLEVLRPIAAGWILFTHVVGPGGRTMNLDHAPLEGLLPLDALRPGTFVRDPIRVALPPGWPRGPVRVELGLYRRGARAPARGAHSAGDAVTVATIEVE